MLIKKYQSKLKKILLLIDKLNNMLHLVDETIVKDKLFDDITKKKVTSKNDNIRKYLETLEIKMKNLLHISPYLDEQDHNSVRYTWIPLLNRTKSMIKKDLRTIKKIKRLIKIRNLSVKVLSVLLIPIAIPIGIWQFLRGKSKDDG